jgi:hypothetical protein
VALSGQPLRFTLRSLMLVVLGAAVLCGALRALVRGDPTFLLGMGSFFNGGIVAIPCYAFVASLMVLTTQSTWGERAGEVFAGLVAVAAWVTFLVYSLGRWPQLCVVYSACATAVIGWMVWQDWQTEAGPSPETTLQRLLSAKRECSERMRTERALRDGSGNGLQ